jgi:hypothetical protein
MKEQIYYKVSGGWPAENLSRYTDFYPLMVESMALMIKITDQAHYDFVNHVYKRLERVCSIYPLAIDFYSVRGDGRYKFICRSNITTGGVVVDPKSGCLRRRLIFNDRI